MKRNTSFFLLIAALITVLSACAPSSDGTTQAPTGSQDLDHVIEVVLSGDADEIRTLIHFTPAKCTNAEGLGGPPKCEGSEAEGTTVEVLPLLGPEGGFVRKENIESWEVPQVSELFAVYETSDAVYTEENYPKGIYAIVFIEENEAQLSYTLQVTDGKIVRVDLGFEFPPQIPENYVKRFLVEPGN